MYTLEALNIWVNWELRKLHGKMTKPPLNPNTLALAKTDDPTTWSDYQTAHSNQTTNNLGVGIMLTDGLCGIDIDGGDNHTTPNPLEAEILALFSGTYAEKSPSETGVHILFYCNASRIPTIDGKLDPRFYQKNPANGIECYFSGLTKRYFTVTENQVSLSNEVTDQTEQVLAFLNRYMKKTLHTTLAEDEFSIDPNILKVILKSKKAKKFNFLYQLGDLSQHKNDHSKADLALCNLLSFFLQGDFDAIDRAFRGSKLYRSKWEREDYRTNTINKAIESCHGQFYRPPGRPKKEQCSEKEKKPFLNPNLLKEYLAQQGIKIQRNIITGKTYTSGLEEENQEYLEENLAPLIYSEIQSLFLNCTLTTVEKYVKILASRDMYNPVKELLSQHTYNGKNQLSELFQIMGIAEDDDLSRVLIMKWLWQSLSLLDNSIADPFGADGILVLTGSQGVGKTSLLRKLAIKPAFFKEGKSINFKDKDSYIRCLRGWISELGEIGSTLKYSIDELKAFITSPTNEYREVYAKGDNYNPRRTSLCGSCNNPDFLVDPTGNRRFWTVPVENIDLQRLAAFDVIQLWKQIELLALSNPQGFRLTRDEHAMLAIRNGKHEKKLPAQEEIEDIFFTNQQGKFHLEPMTVSDFKSRYDSLRNYSVAQIGKALDQLGYQQERKQNQRLRHLPMPQ